MGKLKVAMIGGGGSGSFFGKVHLRAVSLDATREVTAGVLRHDPAAAMEAANEWGIQGFPDLPTMLKAWKAGRVELDYAVVTTPNFAHFASAKACLEAGLPVLCEKPMTLTVAESEELARLVKKSKLPFVLAHTYTGHPMMMTAKCMVADGTIGEIRKIESWYNQGWLSAPLEKSGQQQASWRTDPKRTGISNCGGDIGTHAFVAATWVGGQAVKKVSARLNRFVPGRTLDDDFNVIGELANGGTAIITATQIAIGYKNDCGFRIYGTKGSLEWHQERAEALIVKNGGADQTFWINGGAGIPALVSSYQRAPGGHNEDFFEALANLHTTMERQVRKLKGEKNGPEAFPHPGVQEGLDGMKFVKAAVESSKAKGAWTKV
ncbi:MAG: Gfo/Idh/MocA family oxidoreductase [Kiritimatiellia bacterium]